AKPSLRNNSPVVQARVSEAKSSAQTNTAALMPAASLARPDAAPVSGEGLDSFNGIGGFNADGEYEIRLTGDTYPPAPWINVIGNPSGGVDVSESGAGATWASNSSFRLTPWQNDPVEDAPGDCIYIRDADNGEIWTATPEPIRESTPYSVKHGAGYSV